MFDKKIIECKDRVYDLDFAIDIYPLEAMSTIRTEKLNGPKMIFMPDRNIIRSLIKAVIEKNDFESEADFLLRFGILDNAERYFGVGKYLSSHVTPVITITNTA